MVRYRAFVGSIDCTILTSIDCRAVAAVLSGLDWAPQRPSVPGQGDPNPDHSRLTLHTAVLSSYLALGSPMRLSPATSEKKKSR
jgi:hypothetical protein